MGTKETILELRTKLAAAREAAQAQRGDWKTVEELDYAIRQHEMVLADEARRPVAAARSASAEAARATLDSIAAERAGVVERAGRFADPSSGAVVGSPLDVTLFDQRHADVERAASARLATLASDAPVAATAADIERAQAVRDAHARIANPIAAAQFKVRNSTAWDVPPPASPAPAKAGTP